ncbi:hypothetical protein GCK32_018053 [Trichostrongylus colubriformis]|uniref:Uncharacterized protein n=1 Tax=Trichostrongylus colubriformis TaxID=6319 RepID=A0AAN8G2S1_TRICO
MHWSKVILLLALLCLGFSEAAKAADKTPAKAKNKGKIVGYGLLMILRKKPTSSQPKNKDTKTETEVTKKKS